jgi:hypothetical protein
MPIINFESLPDSARIWVYGADRDLSPEAGQKLLESVDAFLSQWAAHGAPLHSARRWDENRFLTIGVDSTKEGASGCSIDVLYRSLKALEPQLGATVVTSGLVYYRDRDGHLQSVTRDTFSDLAAKGEINGDTEVYDLSVTSLNEWRSRFRSRAADSWHASLMPEATAKS